MKRTMLAALVLVPLTAVPARAQVKDLAELFPARTKVYLEINQIGQVVKEVRALFKGSVVDDLPASLEKLRAKLPDEHVYSSLLQWFAHLGPEMVAEIGKFKSGAVGLLEHPKDVHQEPEIVAVLLT